MDWFSVLSVHLVLFSITGEAYGGARKKIRIHIPQKVKHIHHHKKIYITQHQAQQTQFAPQYASSEQYAPAFMADPISTDVTLTSEERHTAPSPRPTVPNIQPLYRARGHYGPTPVYTSSKRLSQIQPAASNKRIKIIKIIDGKKKRLVKKKKSKRIIIKESARHPEKDSSLMSTYHDAFYSDVSKNQNNFKTIRKPKRVEKYIDGDTEHIHTYSEEHVHQYVYDEPSSAGKPGEEQVIEGVTVSQKAVPFVTNLPPTHAISPYDTALHHAMHSSVHPSIILASSTLLPSAHPTIHSVAPPKVHSTVHPRFVSSSHDSKIPASHVPGLTIQSTASTKQHTINALYDGSMGSLGTPGHMAYMGYDAEDVTHDHVFHDHGEINQNQGFHNQMVPPPPITSYDKMGVKINSPHQGRNKKKHKGKEYYIFHHDSSGKDSLVHPETSDKGSRLNQKNPDKESWSNHEDNHSEKGSWAHSQDNLEKDQWLSQGNSKKRPWITQSDANKDLWGPPNNSDRNPWSSHDSATKGSRENNDYSYYEKLSSKLKSSKPSTKQRIPKYLHSDEITLNSEISFDASVDPMSSYSSIYSEMDHKKKSKRKPSNNIHQQHNILEIEKQPQESLNHHHHHASELKPHSTIATFEENDSYNTFKNNPKDTKDSYSDIFRNYKDSYSSADTFGVDAFATSMNQDQKEKQLPSLSSHWRSKKNKPKKKSVSTQNISFGGQEHKTMIDHIAEDSKISPTIDTSIHEMIHEPPVVNIAYSPQESYYNNIPLKAFEGSSPMTEASNINIRVVEAPNLRSQPSFQSRGNSGSQKRESSTPKSRDISSIQSRESNSPQTESSVIIEYSTVLPVLITHAPAPSTSSTTEMPRKQKKRRMEKQKTKQSSIKEVQKQETKAPTKPKPLTSFTSDRGKYKYGDRLQGRSDYEYDELEFI